MNIAAWLSKSYKIFFCNTIYNKGFNAMIVYTTTSTMYNANCICTGYIVSTDGQC